MNEIVEPPQGSSNTGHQLSESFGTNSFERSAGH